MPSIECSHTSQSGGLLLSSQSVEEREGTDKREEEEIGIVCNDVKGAITLPYLVNNGLGVKTKIFLQFLSRL